MAKTRKPAPSAAEETMAEEKEEGGAEELHSIEIEVGGEIYDALVDEKAKELLETKVLFAPGRPFLLHMEPGVCPAIEEEGAKVTIGGKHFEAHHVRTRHGVSHTEVFVRAV